MPKNKIWYIPRDQFKYIDELDCKIVLKSGKVFSYIPGDIIITIPVEDCWAMST